MSSEAQKAGDKIIEVQFKFGGYGYLQVIITIDKTLVEKRVED